MPWCPVIQGFMNQNCLYYNVLIIDSFACLRLRWTAAQSSRLSSDCWMFARCVSVLRWSCKFPENNTKQIQVKFTKKIRTTRREKKNDRTEIFISFWVLSLKQCPISTFSILVNQQQNVMWMRVGSQGWRGCIPAGCQSEPTWRSLADMACLPGAPSARQWCRRSTLWWSQKWRWPQHPQQSYSGPRCFRYQEGKKKTFYRRGMQQNKQMSKCVLIQ